MNVLELLFPPRCVACAGVGWPICDGCAPGVGVVSPPICARCGRPAEEPLRSCAECPPFAVDVVRAPLVYEGPVAAAIRGMKFSGWRALARHLAAAMAEAAEGLDAEVVTWVPLSRRRRSRRGFDQAEALARPLAATLDLPVRRLLARRRDTSEQARRGARDRRSALRGAFVAVGRPPESVLLVDDVLTTGSTAAACAEALKGAGAARVAVVVAARALRGPVPARCFGDGTAMTGSVR